MSTNIYDLEERISFNPEKPELYYGWYITTTSSELKVAHFKRPELRKQMAAEVAVLFPDSKDDAELLAACALVMALGGDTGDPDFAEDIATGVLSRDPGFDKSGEKWESLREIGDKYAENYE